MASVASILLLLASVLCTQDSVVPVHPIRPDGPIRIVVYTGPGGLIDTTARRFQAIASRYTDIPIIVLNKPGGGGVTAFQSVIDQPADGTWILAVTRSNIPSLIAAGRESLLDETDFAALLMEDPECVITRTESALVTMNELLRDALADPGNQSWSGPAIGGLDHIVAMKLWQASGIDVRWVPYRSGGQAKAVLLGGHTVAYMGNPRDAHGNDKLTIAAVAVPERLSAYPEVPTFKELGIKGIDREVMWRGLALRKGTPPDAMVWFRNLVRQVTLDPEWRDEWEETGIIVMDEGPEVFNGIVAQDRIFFHDALSRLELLNEARKVSWLQWMVVGLILLIGIILAIVLSQLGRQHQTASVLLGLGLAGTALIAMAAAFELPPANAVDQLGSSAAPWLWAFLLFLFAAAEVVKQMRHPSGDQPPRHVGCRPFRPLAFIMGMAGVVLLMPLLGYYIVTGIFLSAASWALGERRLMVICVLVASWCIGSWVLFAYLLKMDLPLGFFMSMGGDAA